MRRFGRRLLASGGAAVWTPNDLSNKVGWWDASAITGKVDGDSVTAWLDSYGLLADATGTATYRTGANGIGGQPALEFNGTSDFFITPYSTSVTGDFFVWAVFEFTGGQNAGTVFSKNTGLLRLSRYSGSTTKVEFALDNVNFQQTIGSHFNNGGNYCFLGRNGNTQYREVNTLTSTHVKTSATLASADFIIGRLDAARHMGGLIPAVGFCSAYPSAGDLTNLRTYITNTYGIATS